MFVPSGLARDHAFSLTELLVVLMLIAVMTSASVVVLKGRDDRHALRASAEDLATALSYAASQATATGEPHRLVFDPSGGSYRIEQSDNAEEVWSATHGLAGQQHHLARGIAIAMDDVDPTDPVASGPTYSFGTGTSDFAGSIVLYDAAGEVLRVDVAPVTRQVTIAAGVSDP